MNRRRLFPIVAGALLALIASTAPSPSDALHCNHKGCLEFDPPFVDVCIPAGILEIHCIQVDYFTCVHDSCDEH
ncbi:MAG: hypothetical protein F4139_08520 [Gemmatimonadetes bacterium]|nr:hypothetical protein [Gemmatimonadota bacterium]MYA63860.1 hypothetical protein [Gemmatimonadota bacterium]MYB97574.1 hypothetical protein [Gemmatimonadota bacterium]MYH52980.1 hypothetical protein [Gemmatimonadota bacterium]MYI46472.1 hypothetical protein [Gemmatimonadota bacterium]